MLESVSEVQDVLVEPGACAATTPSLRMEVKAASEAVSWLMEQDDWHGIVVADSHSMLQRTKRFFFFSVL